MQQERESIKQLPAAVVTIAKSIIGKKDRAIELEKQKALAEVQQSRQDLLQELESKQKEIDNSKSELSWLIGQAKAAQKEAGEFIEGLKKSPQSGMPPLAVTQEDIDNFRESRPEEFQYLRCCLEARRYGMNNKEVRQLMSGNPVTLRKGKEVSPGLRLQEDITAILKKTKEGVAVICAEFIKNGKRILDTFRNLISYLKEQKLSQYQQRSRGKGMGM